MEFRSYNQELGISNLLFKRLFSNIRIDKAVANGEQRVMTVKCIFDQKSRVFRNWQNAEKKSMYQLPMIVIDRRGYNRSPDRVNNMQNEVKYEITSKSRCYEIMSAVPIDIAYDVTIFAKDPSDIDQIASNFIVFFNSGLYVSCMHPKYDNVKLNNQVIMGDSVSEEHNPELDPGWDDIMASTFNFNFRTFLFAGKSQPRKHKKIPVTVLSTVLSSETIAIKARDILDLLKDNPELEVLSSIDKEVQVEVTSYEDISSDPSEELIPTIKSIHAGWYGINSLCADFDQEMDNIDSYIKPLKFKDSLVWKIDAASVNEFPQNVIPTLNRY